MHPLLTDPLLTDPRFYAVAVPAVIILGLSKGGFSNIGTASMPLLALVLPPVQAAAMLLPLLIIQDVVAVWAFRRTWDKRNLALLLPAGAFGVLLGYLFAAQVSESAVRLLVGFISVTFSVQQLVKYAVGKGSLARRGNWLLGLVCGTASGFTSTIVHAGSPPLQIYLLPQRLEANYFVGTLSIFFAVVNWMKVVPYAALGEFSHETMLLSAALLPVAIISTFAGVWLVRRVPAERFNLLMYTLLLLIGIKLGWDGFAGLRLLT
jgi:hypothetical protein